MLLTSQIHPLPATQQRVLLCCCAAVVLACTAVVVLSFRLNPGVPLRRQHNEATGLRCGGPPGPVPGCTCSGQRPAAQLQGGRLQGQVSLTVLLLLLPAQRTPPGATPRTPLACLLTACCLPASQLLLTLQLCP